MVRTEDYRKADGLVDWEAYHKARQSAGETCMTCGKFMLPNLFHPENTPIGPRECGYCRAFKEDTGEILDDDRVRCPFCKYTFSFGDYISENANYEYYEPREHSVDCPECEKDFTILTHVSYSYTSPAIGKGGIDE